MSFYDPISDFYSKPQVGAGGIGIYQGSRRQTGGGIFASIQRFAIPILRRIGEKLISIAPSVGAKALEVVKETLSDVRRGKRVGAALKSNVANKLQKTMEQHGLISPSNDQEGSGKGRRRSHKKKSHKKKRVTVTKPKKSINKRKSIKKKISKKKKSVVKNHRKSFRDIFA